MTCLENYRRCKLTPNSIILYNSNGLSGSKKVIPLDKNEIGVRVKGNFISSYQSNCANGILSPRAQSRLRKSIKYLFWLSGSFVIYKKKVVLKPKSKICFVTLTLCASQFHSDIYIKSKMLNQFLTELRYTYGHLNYIWRAEKQKNNNIHIHILISEFIPWSQVRIIWNRIQKHHGYISRYQDKFSGCSFSEYCKLRGNYNKSKFHQFSQSYHYGISSNWTDPNSIDVHGMRNVTNIFKYISKYLSKNHSNKDKADYDISNSMNVSGRLYFCSTSISQIKPYSDSIDYDMRVELGNIITQCPSSIIVQEWYTIIALPIEDIHNLGAFLLFKLFLYNFNDT